MKKKDKQELSEADIAAKFITPALVDAGWDEMAQIRREFPLTPGQVIANSPHPYSDKYSKLGESKQPRQGLSNIRYEDQFFTPIPKPIQRRTGQFVLDLEQRVGDSDQWSIPFDR